MPRHRRRPASKVPITIGNHARASKTHRPRLADGRHLDGMRRTVGGRLCDAATNFRLDEATTASRAKTPSCRQKRASPSGPNARVPERPLLGQFDAGKPEHAPRLPLSGRLRIRSREREPSPPTSGIFPTRSPRRDTSGERTQRRPASSHSARQATARTADEATPYVAAGAGIAPKRSPPASSCRRNAVPSSLPCRHVASYVSTAPAR